MTNDLEFAPGDFRRATALLAHYATADTAGVAEVWREAAEVGSWPGLTAAVVAAFFEIVPGLRTEEGVAALRQFAAAFAASEASDHG